MFVFDGPQLIMAAAIDYYFVVIGDGLVQFFALLADEFPVTLFLRDQCRLLSPCSLSSQFLFKISFACVYLSKSNVYVFCALLKNVAYYV